MFQTLPGFRTFYPEDCSLRNHLFRLWRQSALAFHFEEYDAPLLEPLDLFIEKSGEEIVGQLFNFEDKGGRHVSLRPELTPSLARLVAAKASSLKRPIRWFCIGENFRYERQQKGRLRSFYQFNADILGEAGPGADAEIVALAAHALFAMGLRAEDFVIRLSDRDLWYCFLEAAGLDVGAIPEALGIADKMERMPQEKTLALLARLPGVDAAQAELLFARMHRFMQLRELAEVETFLKALAPQEAVLARIATRLAAWQEWLAFIQAAGAGPCSRIDFGIVRGLAYYTGFVFEIFQTGAQARALAGGGRYDHLVRKLGGPDMPATGFAMGDVTVRDLLEEKGLLPTFVRTPDLYMAFTGEPERLAMLADAAMLREAGFRVDYALHPLGFGKQMRQASQSGAAHVLLYGGDELAQGALRIKELRSGTERVVPRRYLVESLQAASTSECCGHGHAHGEGGCCHE